MHSDLALLATSWSKTTAIELVQLVDSVTAGQMQLETAIEGRLVARRTYEPKCVIKSELWQESPLVAAIYDATT